MKNLYNFGFVVLLLVVLGCNCQKLKELADESRTASSPTPYAANTSSSPTNTASSTPAKSSSTDLTLAKYNQVKNGMTYKEVVDIMGSEGVQQSSSGEGKYKVETYKWEGNEPYQFISVIFMDEKVYSKIQAGVK